MIKKVLLICLCAMGISLHAFAAEPEDFTYRGLKLGDDHQTMIDQLGEPRVDVDHIVGDQVVTYYIYRDTRIGIDMETKKIVDIRIADKDYTAENGVKLGATPHKLIKEYGKAKRERIGGRIFYIYHQVLKPEEKLMLEISEGFLAEIRITNLNA